MGKDSKLKKERARQRKLLNLRTQPKDTEFTAAADRVASFILGYHPTDVYLSIAVSDLWPPNIASHARHTFALQVLLSLNSSGFDHSRRIDSHSELASFLAQLREVLPSFPQLDDFLPQTDWGELKLRWKGKFYRYFYGCSVHRIPDHVTAFELIYRENSAAITDLGVALEIQNFVISQIHPSISDSEEPRTGQITIPSQEFWHQCRSALLRAYVETSAPSQGNPRLFVSQGEVLPPRSRDKFGNSVLEGNALPYLWVLIIDKTLPLKPREALGAAIDHWTAKAHRVRAPDGNATPRIAEFLQARFSSGECISGPFTISIPNSCMPYSFAGAIFGPGKLHLILSLRHQLLDRLPRILRSLSPTPTKANPWQINIRGADERERHIIDHSIPIEFIVVLPTPSISLRINLPRGSWHIAPLPDFITIFDSVSGGAELERFCDFLSNRESMTVSYGGSLANHFAAFRDSNETLLAGASRPTMVHIVPHWESIWRFQELKKWWSSFPPIVPYSDTIEWKPSPEESRPYLLVARDRPSASWWLAVGSCTLHFVVHLSQDDISTGKGEMIALVAHCLADSLEQRREVVLASPVFLRQMIVTVCSMVESERSDNHEGTADRPLFCATGNVKSGELVVDLGVDLDQVEKYIDTPKDAYFEALCVRRWIEALADILDLPEDPAMAESIMSTSSRKARFTAQSAEWNIDAPTSATRLLPTDADYKKARKILAFTLAKLEVAPGDYTLSVAKKIVNAARDYYRERVHQEIASFDQSSLVRFCIRQHEALIIHHKRESMRLQASLGHEVEYDRLHEQSSLQEEFSRSAKNYRYILEHSLSSESFGTSNVSRNEALRVVALVDWLMVLYSTSDVLHHAMSAAGVRIDEDFIPTVYHNPDHHPIEERFSRKNAAVRLGIAVDEQDAVGPEATEIDVLHHMDQSFLEDAGFRFSHLLQLLIILSRWSSSKGESDKKLSYQATQDEIVSALQKHGTDVDRDTAIRAVEFATLKPHRIRKLLGQNTDEDDVPVWEHHKREYRYTIRPLVPVGHSLVWGAATAQRSGTIWAGSVSEGYLPVDFQWPNVRARVREIKKSIEDELETRALEIVRRHCRLARGNLDFRALFPHENFDDVGDFDVLAYWPAQNTWLSVECKYNAPAFCPKDSRRLRDRIFGTSSKKGHFEKIDRRRRFLEDNILRLRLLLGWPASTSGKDATIQEVYVCRRVDWWLEVAPPNATRTFSRIDQLDGWLRSLGFVDTPVSKGT